MKIKIYKILRDNGWTSKGVDQKHNVKMGISKCFMKDNCYCEVYKESYGFSIHLYGSHFMRGYYPSHVDIVSTKDLDILRKTLL